MRVEKAVQVLRLNMIDPTKITDYNLTTAQLQERLLWWLFAAGHNAMSAAKGIDRFLERIKKSARSGDTPFRQMVSMRWNEVVSILEHSGLGCWRIKSRTIKELIEANLDLKTCSIEELESIHGIGAKTARCFVLHSRKGVDNIACLDTHILKYMKEQGVDVPKSTPTKRKYLELEKEFLKLHKESNMTLAEFDLMIWNQGRGT